MAKQDNPRRLHIKNLIDNLKLGQSVQINGDKVKFDSEIALANFKLGLILADVIYMSDSVNDGTGYDTTDWQHSAIDREGVENYD